MLKVSRILSATVFYHGRGLTRPYTGKYIFLTADPAYASGYSDGKTIQVYKLKIHENELFSLRKAGDLSALTTAMNNPEATQSIMKASSHGEMDWAAYSNIASDDHDDGESLLKSLGFKGIWLSERTGINSILLFDQNDADYVKDIPAVFRKPMDT